MCGRRVGIALFAALVACAAIAAPAARADEGELERAQEHFEAGKALFDAGRYRAAMTEFARADAIVSSPVNSYNIALCHDQLGESEAAVREYRTYLEAMPEAPNRREVEARIAALERSAPEETPERAPAESDDVGSAPTPEDRAESESARSGEAAEDRAESEPARSGEAAEERADDAAGGSSRDRDPQRDEPEPPRGLDEERSADRGYSTTEPAPRHQPGDEPDPPRKAKPLYKSWWFWGVAGVSALILLNIATADSSDGAANLELFEPPASGGMTLWRF